MKHFTIVGVLTIVVTILVWLLLTSIPLVPAAAAAQAGPVDQMIYLQVGLISFLFALITVAVVYSIVVFRRKAGEENRGQNISGSTRLEILWTLLPLATVIYLSFVGGRALNETLQVDPNAMVVKVIAYQWGWSFQYPDYDITSSQLYLPLNRQVKFEMTSRDVIHSFWVPEFRIKQDVLPGANLVKTLRITPTRAGEYQVLCAELCGGAHALMTAPVRVVSQADFEAWTAEQGKASTATPEQRGQKLATSNGCVGCHSLDGSRIVGPTWKGLYMSEVELADGSKVVADDAYIHDFIINPEARNIKGYPAGVMPANYKDVLTEEQIKDIIAFIKTLK